MEDEISKINYYNNIYYKLVLKHIVGLLSYQIYMKIGSNFTSKFLLFLCGMVIFMWWL